MLEAACQKKIMNGSVPELLEKPKQDDVDEKVAEIVHKFYKGDKLTPLELDIERMYISEKMEKQQNYGKKKSYRFKVRWTVSDLNRFQDQANYRMNDNEYFGNTKPQFVPFDLDMALECMYVHQDI